MSPGASKTYLLTTGEDVREVSAEELPQVLEGLRLPGPAIWIHTGPTPSAIQALDDMGLDEIAVKSLREGPERPRVEEFADHLYVSLFSAGRAVGRGGQRLPAEVGSESDAEHSPPPLVLNELRLFLTDRWIISVGDLEPDDYAHLVDRMKRQVFSRQRGSSFVAYHLCEWLVESLQPALDTFDDRIDALEDEVVLGTGDAAMRELFGLKRDLVDLRRRVAPVRDVMQVLGSHGVLYVEPEAEVYFRDVHDDVMRMIELLDTYRDILSSALDLHLSSVSNRLNIVMKKLMIVATVFLPLSFLAGFFGINFTRMPFGSTTWFVLMFVLMALSVGVMAFYTRKKT